MPIIQPFMAVKCRTADEVAIFEETARAEGHKFSSGSEIYASKSKRKLFVVNYCNSHGFPEDVAITDNPDYVDHYPGNCKIIVEAADLFRNKLISRRIKHEQSMGR